MRPIVLSGLMLLTTAAGEGETCGSGFFGTPQIDCAAGLVCTYPNGTAPQGPDGSSSGATGICQAP